MTQFTPKVERLINLVVEEGSEFTKEDCKGRIYGYEDKDDDGTTPLERLKIELVDLYVVVGMLIGTDLISLDEFKALREAKMARLRKYHPSLFGDA